MDSPSTFSETVNSLPDNPPMLTGIGIPHDGGSVPTQVSEDVTSTQLPESPSAEDDARDLDQLATLQDQQRAASGDQTDPVSSEQHPFDVAQDHSLGSGALKDSFADADKLSQGQDAPQVETMQENEINGQSDMDQNSVQQNTLDTSAHEPLLETVVEQHSFIESSVNGASPIGVEGGSTLPSDLNTNPIDALALPDSRGVQPWQGNGQVADGAVEHDVPQDSTDKSSQQPSQEAIYEDYAPYQTLSEEEIAARNALIARIKSALLAQESMRSVNVSLQHKLSDLFRKRRAEDKNSEPDKSVTDQDQRFANVMTSLKQLRNEYDTMERTQQQVDQEFKAKLQDRKQEFSERSEEFRKYRRQVAVSSENSRTGKSIPLKVVEQLEAQDSRKEAEVAAVRLENIKLRNKLKRHEQTLRQKEELAEGLHLIDFEQLKIENQTYNEKIEERNEELMKLRKKITNVVQVLAHIKEKLQFVQEENSSLTQDLTTIDEHVGQERDQLPISKQQRDQLRSRNNYLKEKNGLLGNDTLLRDFEQRVDEVQALKAELTQLKELYGQLTRAVKVQQAHAYNQAVLPMILN